MADRPKVTYTCAHHLHDICQARRPGQDRSFNGLGYDHETGDWFWCGCPCHSDDTIGTAEHRSCSRRRESVLPLP